MKRYTIDVIAPIVLGIFVLCSIVMWAKESVGLEPGPSPPTSEAVEGEVAEPAEEIGEVEAEEEGLEEVEEVEEVEEIGEEEVEEEELPPGFEKVRKKEIVGEKGEIPVTAKEVELSIIESFFQKKLYPETAGLRQFGYDFFNTPPPEPLAPVPEDYLLGPGDSFFLYLWGDIEQFIVKLNLDNSKGNTFELNVDREGKVFFPRLGTIYVWGKTLKEAEQLIQEKIARFVKDFRISLTMSGIRTFPVYVVGEVKNPGVVMVTGVSTISDALLMVGGPKKSGSLRNITLRRGKRVIRHIDMYELFLKGKKVRETYLREKDVIYVPVITAVFGVTGNVKRSAIYEIKGNLNVKEAIQIAGGILPIGDIQKVQLERYEENRRKVLLDTNLEDLSKANNTRLIDGDLIKVYPIYDVLENVVHLEGHVKKPGIYEFKEGMRLSDLIPSFDVLLPQPALEYGEIIRLEGEESRPTIVPFNLGRLLKGDDNEDHPLQRADMIRIFSRWEYEDIPRVTIEGDVRNPGSYPLYEKMRISDLVYKAGDLTKESLLDEAELFRLTPDRELKRMTFNLKSALKGDPDHNILLMDEDRVVIHNIWETKWRKMVYVGGMVNKPGEYPLAEGMRVRDLIFEAGNLKKNAYLKKAELVRYDISQEGVTTRKLELDLEDILYGEGGDNLLLKDYDYLYIRIIPELELESTATVTGEVMFPGTYPISRQERLSSLLKRAGGFTKDAYLRGTVFNRESVRKLQKERVDQAVERMQRELAKEKAELTGEALTDYELAAKQAALREKASLLEMMKSRMPPGRVVIRLLEDLEAFEGSDYDMVLENEDNVFIPRVPSHVMVIGEVHNSQAFLHKPDHSVNYYLSQAGGLTDDADEENIFVIQADGSAMSKRGAKSLIEWEQASGQLRLFASLEDMNLMPGDAIFVPSKVKIPTRWIDITKDIVQILYQSALTTAVVLTVFKPEAYQK